MRLFSLEDLAFATVSPIHFQELNVTSKMGSDTGIAKAKDAFTIKIDVKADKSERKKERL